MRRTGLVLIVLVMGVMSLGQTDDRSIKMQMITQAPLPPSEHRTALVIGNSAYETAALQNPVNDARAMAQALRGLGFEVSEIENATQRQMKEAIDTFGATLRQGGVGLFHFSGHGLQVRGRNYLLPVGAKLSAEPDVEYEAVDAGRVLAKMESAKNRLNMVILDACRNNPFARSFRSPSLGLAMMDAPSGTLIAYATAPGQVASDDAMGSNGLYTGFLLKHMRRPGLKVEDVLKAVRSDVKKQSGGLQVPWESSSLEGDFYFTPPDPAGADTPQRVPAEAAPPPVRPPVVHTWTPSPSPSPTPAQIAVWSGAAPRTPTPRVSEPASTQTGRPQPVPEPTPTEMVTIPGGAYLLGSTEARPKADEYPPQRVQVRQFSIDRTEVAAGQYVKCVKAGVCKSSQRVGQANCTEGVYGLENHPVNCVDWNQAKAYCEWAGKRLPTEAEWEIAAVGTTGSVYPWGNEPPWEGGAPKANVRRASQGGPKRTPGPGTTAPVGSHPADASPFGIFDMAGNVSEWTSSRYSSDGYAASDTEDGSSPNPFMDPFTPRVIRGGSWWGTDADCRAARRDGFAPSNSTPTTGFRCAR